jgi:Invasion associated locus B (IalB) protein
MMIRKFLVFVLALLALALGGSSMAFAQSREALGRFKDWDAYKTTVNGQVACFAVSKPKDMLPKGVNRDPVFFIITNWPGRNVTGEPSIQTGYPYRPGSNAAVTVGGRSYDFFTKDDGAWLASPDDEKKLIDDMRKGTTMVVKGTSSRGTTTTDRYSLSGSSAALDKVAEACK